jgi:hypothetical protein
MGQGAAMSIDDSANFNLHGESVIDLRLGQLDTNSDSRTSLQNSIMQIRSATVSANQNSTISLQDKSKITLHEADGVLSFNQSASLHVEDSQVDIQAGLVQFLENSYLHGREAVITIRGSLVFYNESSSLLEDYSKVNLIYGSVELNNNTQHSIVDHATIEIENGDFFMRNQAIVLFRNDGNLTLLDGNLVLDDISKISMEEQSSIELRNGNMNLFHDAQLNVAESSIRVYAGNVNLERTAGLNLTSSSLTVGKLQTSEGFFLATSYSEVNISDSVLSVHGGAFTIASHAIFRAERQSRVLVSNGDLDVGGNAFFVNQSAMIVAGGNFYSGSKSLLGESSIVNILGGQLVFRYEQKANWRKSTFIVDSSEQNGSFLLQDYSYTNISSSVIQISAGSTSLLHLATMNLRDSSMFVQSYLSMNASTTLAIFENSSVFITGLVQLSGNANVKLDNSRMLVDPPDNSTVLGEDTQFRMKDSSVVVVDQGSFLNVSGTVQILDSASLVVMYGSQMNILGSGVLQVFNSSTLMISNNSHVIVESGKVFTDEQSHIVILNNSTLTNSDYMELLGPISIHPQASVNFQKSSVVKARKGLQVTGMDSSSSMSNSGMIDLCTDISSQLLVPFENHGEMHFCSGAVDLSDFKSLGSLKFKQSSLRTNQTAQFGGRSSGHLQLEGDLHLSGNLEHDPDEGTHYQISGSLTTSSSSVLNFRVNDKTSPGKGFTKVAVQSHAHLDGTINICLKDFLKQGDRIELINYEKFTGRFARVTFNCPDGESSSTDEENSCDPVEDYGARSFAVLLDPCAGSSESISVFGWVALACICGAFVFCIICVLCYELVPPFKQLVLGKEGSRIAKVRVTRSRLRGSSSLVSRVKRSVSGSL